jgi:hypothetical protein
MKYPPITYKLLKEKKACQSQLDLFEQHIGLNEPIPLTDETIQNFSKLFDIIWAANNLLDFYDCTEFYKAIAPAADEYNKAMAPAYAEYLKADETAYSKYQKAKDILLAEYNKAKDPVQAEFKKAIATALAEFKKAIATVFVRLYKQGMTS